MTLDFKGFNHRKNDRFRTGNTVYVGAGLTNLCAIRAVEEQLEVVYGTKDPSKIRPNSPLFPGQSKSKPGVSAEAVCTQLKEAFCALGLDISIYRGHSCRVGGATAAHNSGIPAEDCAKHGGWADLFTYHGYGELNIPRRLNPSLGVGL
jgi:hypothetical protein